MEKKYKVLLADDEDNIRLLGEKLLKESGYDVVLAANGSEAIDKAIKERPDIVITDIRMPQKNGFEVCKALRSDPVLNQVPILILSALGDEFNKLTGFEGGANDFITKPFRAEELKDRIMLLLEHGAQKVGGPKPHRIVPEQPEHKIEQIPTGVENLDKVLGGGLPKGSNILLFGPLGRGKSTFARRFIVQGLVNGERCLYVAVDDDPILIRSELNKTLAEKTSAHENNLHLRFIDAYTWSAGEDRENELYKVEGVLSLDQLSSLLSQAGNDIGQTVQQKMGGRRVIDSISSFFVNFDLPSVQRFLSQVGRTALAFGGVTSLFVIEEGSVSDQAINNIKYLMDGVIEFKEDIGKKKLRVSSMKWIKYEKDWVSW